MNVFTYGILMRRGTVPATLENHRLAFGRFATVEEAPGETVYGAVITDVTEEQLRSLDCIEGCRQGNPERSYYQRKIVRVHVVGDQYLDAWVYQMTDRYPERMAPSPSLVDQMLSEYERLGHPEEADWQLHNLALTWPPAG